MCEGNRVEREGRVKFERRGQNGGLEGEMTELGGWVKRVERNGIGVTKRSGDGDQVGKKQEVQGMTTRNNENNLRWQTQSRQKRQCF